MLCEICGGEFRPSGHGRRQRYCSESCRNKAKYRRRKARMQTGETKPSAPTAAHPSDDLDRRQFERMMDDGIEDILRLNRDRLKTALQDPSTPANALPGISRQLIAVCERLDAIDGGDLLADTGMEEVSDDAYHAEIV
ncbi:hypothetical protein [Bifidobacterium phasiani]|uniref:Uncharacterized protein n=1 Tax=Bifidobacterium phasiani TaxID=2834431 RepID=A0ABS6W677_9BIFI|nr:hypothetical protein [Bifidobacterium phasiani]MBW3081979.1 hypothetical protein [Bifidobacterium phasiani]